MKYLCTDWRSQRLLSEIRWKETHCSQALDNSQRGRARTHWPCSETQSHPEIFPLGFALRAPITNTPEGLLRRWALQGWGSWGLWRASLAWCWGRETAVLCHPNPLGATVWKSPHSPQAHQIYAALDRPPNPLLQLPWNAETVTAVIHFEIRKSFKPRWSYQ